MTAQIITLRDAAGGSSAKILASQGFNCFSFITSVNGHSREALWAEEGFENGDRRASSSGSPILFPFPGRVQGTVVEWDGQSYQLEEGDRRGNAIHGFVHTRPWRVMEQSETTVTGEFQASVDEPNLLTQWPADFRIRATYTLSSNELSANQLLLDIEIVNPSDKPLPCGLGVHPYFRVPDGAAGEACKVTLPVGTQWEMNDMIASGTQTALVDAARYQAGLTFKDMQFDNGFGGLVFDGSWCQSEIIEPDGVKTVLQFDDAYRECVVYNPPHRQAVCVEPYTCVCDPFRLQPQGIDAGLRVLANGESFTAKMKIVVVSD